MPSPRVAGSKSSPSAFVPSTREIPVFGPTDSKLGYEYRPGKPPWIMVPEGKTRRLLLGLNMGLPTEIRNVDDQGRFIHSHSPIYTARLRGNELSITGHYPAHGVPVELYQPVSQLRVFVSILTARTLPIIVHYVEHGPRLRTQTTREQLKAMIAVANEILVPQANIRLLLAIEGVLSHERIGKNLGQHVRYGGNRANPRDEWNLITKHKLGIAQLRWHEYEPLNLFLVSSLRGRKDFLSGIREDPGGATDDGCCIFEDHDDTTMRGEALAHEAVHHLLQIQHFKGEHHKENEIANLMYPSASGGRRLTRQQVDTLNSMGLRFS